MGHETIRGQASGSWRIVREVGYITLALYVGYSMWTDSFSLSFMRELVIIVGTLLWVLDHVTKIMAVVERNLRDTLAMVITHREERGQ